MMEIGRGGLSVIGWLVRVIYIRIRCLVERGLCVLYMLRCVSARLCRRFEQ